jgi:phosphate transport system permease protein
MNRQRFFWRRLKAGFFFGLCWLAAGFGLVALGLILWDLLLEGAAGITPDLFRLDTPPPQVPGGLRNALAGSLEMILVATLVGTPIGVLAGTYLAEYGRFSRLSVALRMLNDILLSAPSIVVGLFVYEIAVAPWGGFSGLAGIVALAVIVIPVVVRTTENMMLLIPDSQREAAAAMGIPQAHVIRRVLWPAARAGIVTGALLAVARISGETAPLLFTSLNSQFFSLDVTRPLANIPATIFQFALSPYDDWHRMAWAGALVVTVAVLALNIVARLLAAGVRK